MIEFNCNSDAETWTGKINYLKDYGNHYEMRIESRSGLHVIFGCSSNGNYICVPDFNVSCYLAHLKDRFWNQEKLTSLLGEVDGITLAEALFNAYDLIE